MMMVDLHRLKSFAVVAELGSFTRAAERLELTQAAVSQHVQKLEAELGSLLIRKRKSLALTPAGRALLAFHQETAAASGRLAHRLTADDAEHGEVSLVTPDSIGLALYPCMLDMQLTAPGLSVRHCFATHDKIVEAVASSACEIGLTSIRPDDARVQARPFCEEPLELIVPAGAQIDSWEDLASLGFIDHPDGAEMAARLFNKRYPDAPAPQRLPRKGFTDQLPLVLESVSRGLGFTVLPRYARLAFVRQDAIQVIAGSPRVADTLWLLHRAEWPLSARAARTVQVIEAFVAKASIQGG